LDLSPHAKISAHFHDTYGFALANTLVAFKLALPFLTVP
jgi:isopropylmalate/homocitrate/citramalate synthase